MAHKVIGFFFVYQNLFKVVEIFIILAYFETVMKCLCIKSTYQNVRSSLIAFLLRFLILQTICSTSMKFDDRDRYNPELKLKSSISYLTLVTLASPVEFIESSL